MSFRDHGRIRGGTRGGQAHFDWKDVKADERHRQNYLGHSIMAPKGRWAEAKDHLWYSRGKGGGGGGGGGAGGAEAAAHAAKANARAAELQAVKAQEDALLRQALGLPPREDAAGEGAGPSTETGAGTRKLSESDLKELELNTSSGRVTNALDPETGERRAGLCVVPKLLSSLCSSFHTELTLLPFVPLSLSLSLLLPRLCLLCLLLLARVVELPGLVPSFAGTKARGGDPKSLRLAAAAAAAAASAALSAGETGRQSRSGSTRANLRGVSTIDRHG